MSDVLDSRQAGGILIRGGVLRTGAYVANILLGVALVALMARHLGAVDYGRFVLVTSIVMIVAGVTEAGLSNIGVREYTLRAKVEQARLLQNLTGFRLVLSSVGFALALTLIAVSGYPKVVFYGTVLTGVGLLLTVIQNTLAVPLVARLRLGWLASIDVLRQAVTVALAALLVLAGATLLPFFAMYVVASAVALGVTVVLVRGDAPLRARRELHEWRKLLLATLPYALAAAIGIVYFRIAIIVLSLVSGETETGFFSVPFRIVEVLAGLAWLFASSAFPLLVRAARDDAERLRYALQRLFDVSILMGALLALALVVGAELAIKIVGGAGFEPSVTVLRLLGPTLVGSFLVATWGFALLSLRRHAALLVANAIALVTCVGATVLLAPAYGADGAAVAVTTTEFVLAGAYGFALMRPRPDLRVGLGAVPRVGVATLAGVAAGIIGEWIDGGAAALLAATTAYVVVAYVVGAVPREVGHALTEPLRGRSAS